MRVENGFVREMIRLQRYTKVFGYITVSEEGGGNFLKCILTC